MNLKENYNIILFSIKEAEEAKIEATAKQMKLQQTKYQHAKHKPSLVMKPSTAVLKNASAEEVVSAVAVAKEKEETYEDKVKANMLTAKEKKMWLALLEHLQQTVKHIESICENYLYK